MRVWWAIVLVGCGFSSKLPSEQLAIDANDADEDEDAMIDAAIDARPDARIMTVVCPVTYTLNVTTNSWYRVVTQQAGWIAARDACAGDGSGSHLVVANSAMELTVIAGLVPGETWVGLTDAQTEATWTWIRPSTYTGGWVNGQPSNNNASPDQDCGEYNSSGWHDDQCATLQAYICECDGLLVAE